MEGGRRIFNPLIHSQTSAKNMLPPNFHAVGIGLITAKVLAVGGNSAGSVLIPQLNMNIGSCQTEASLRGPSLLI
jgi:hypothetical protein